LYSRRKAVGEEAWKTGSNIINDILNKEAEQPVGVIFKNHFSEGKGSQEGKIKNMRGYGLGLKRNVSRKMLSVKANYEREE